jgi:hypothetical protein
MVGLEDRIYEHQYHARTKHIDFHYHFIRYIIIIYPGINAKGWVARWSLEEKGEHLTLTPMHVSIL